MSCSKFNFRREIIVLTLIWAICSILIYNIFPSSPYQGQSVIIFYAGLITTAFWPALFLFLVYLSLWFIIEMIFERIKKQQMPAEQPQEPAN